RLVNNSLAARVEGRIVASIEGQLDFDGAIVLQFGRSVAGDLVSLVEPAPSEEDDAAAVSEFHGGIDDAEGELTASVLAELEVSRFDEVEVVAIPEVRLEDPPPADQLAASWGGHAAAPISFGALTRL